MYVFTTSLPLRKKGIVQGLAVSMGAFIFLGPYCLPESLPSSLGS